jgi:hypothetical protein
MKISRDMMILVTLVVFISSLFLLYKANNQSPIKNSEIKYDQKSQISYWQTYDASPYLGVHEYVKGSYEFRVEQIKKPSSDFHSGFAFVSNKKLVFEDRANWKQFILTTDGSYQKVKIPNTERGNYKTSNRKFSYDSKHNVISACLISNPESCISVSIKLGTFPYVYASKNNSVIAITNYGDALLFKEGTWCRMQMNNDVYRCATPMLAPIQEPRKIQFYSSVVYRDRVLIGEWPTGRIYEFDGKELKPSNMTPPFIERQVASRLGYEAQSMAEYCGDLFVGYWPKGELWRWDHIAEKWSLFHRFFTSSPDEAFIPYSDRPKDNLDNAFFGQRITGLVPFSESLYVTTSNLLAWRREISALKILEKEKVKEYGAIYKVTRYGCKSTYFDSH